VDVQLAQDVNHVGAFGLYGDAQLFGDVFTVEALAEGQQDLFFAGVSLSMALLASYSSWRLRLTMRSISTTSAGESRAPRPQTSHGVDDLAYRGGLMEHPGGTGLHGPGEPCRFQAGAQDQCHNVGTGRELLDEPEPVAVRQREVHDGDV
jgi:hypothetical protein